ncbi:hypothetical protein SGLAD_v1c03570 [Spiroplasma gladiatoris]|uniref:Uncharacterized protein n=1 Tax=Spiroplasma gladiatoris TaxID=2143 RepID=A0A4P7AIT0_9MOLU|nr:hypothetical protein [Spiroplasma gladiatoris]QBQ07556.1 hypothetical protein SGLAD_v1c03570 [Spiroplasma gladiatoris]
MAEKIKVLQINKSNSKPELTKKKSFIPVEKVWFENTVEDDLTNFDLEKTINIKNKNSAKISLVQNANSHFFAPKEENEISFKSNDIGNNQFDTLNIVDRRIVKRPSQLPPDIIKLRQLSYIKEQKLKEIMLDKLNVNLKFKNNFKNYRLIEGENKTNNLETLEVLEDNKKVNSNEEFFSKEIDLEVKDIKNEIYENKIEKNIFLQNDIQTNKNENLEKTNFLNKININESNSNQQSINNQILDLELEVKNFENKVEELANHEVAHNKVEELANHEIAHNKVEELANHEVAHNKVEELVNHEVAHNKVEETLHNNNNSNKEITARSIPVINDLSFKLDDQTDDLDRAIRTKVINEKKIFSNEGPSFSSESSNTTILVENIVKSAKSINDFNLESSKYDDFEAWLNNSKEMKKIAKIAKKEEKRMLKLQKGSKNAK